jgi:erythromycin esterase-like protein
MKQIYRYLLLGTVAGVISLAIFLWSLRHFVYQTDQQFNQPDQTQPPAPSAVEDWIRTHAVHLNTVEPDSDFSDIKLILNSIGSAQLVCLGEATHGTREFFKLKHRVLEFLVTQKGFTVFGIEAAFPESFDINR